MSTLRISNIEAKSVPASATTDEKIKITNSSGDVLVFLDGKTSGITTVGINTTDGNITFDANSNIVVTGIITATKFVGTIEPTDLTVSGKVSVGGSVTAATFYGNGANLTGLPAGTTINNNTNNYVVTATGTANTLQGEGNLKFDGTNLGVGVDPSGVSSYSTIHLKGQTSGNGGAVRLTDHGDTPDSDDFTIYKNSASGYLRINGTDPLIAYLNGANRLHIKSDGKITVGDGNNLAADYDATMLIDGGDNTRLTVYGSTTGTGTLAFSDGSGSGATKMAGFIQMNHNSTDNGPRLNMGLSDTSMVHLRAPGSNRGQLEVYGNFNESDTPAIELNDSGDARKVFLTSSAGDFNALTRNGGQTKGQLKMFESGVLVHNMKNPLATSTLQSFRTGVYHTTPGSTYTSLSPIVNYLQKGGVGTYDCFEEGNCELEVNGGGNDHYQPVAFVPRGYNLDTTSFGGQWAGEMWIHQTSSQNPTNYGYSGYNTWATMSFKCRWDCAHWNAKPSGFWVEHYINQGRGNIGKIDASETQSQFVIYLLPGSYKIRWNCVRGMAVHRAVSDGAALTLRDGGSFVTYSTLAYSSRNTSFDSQISPGSASFAYCS